MSIESKKQYLLMNEYQHRFGFSRSAVNRHANHGIRGVKLKTYQIGGRIFTTEDDIEEFISRLTAARDGEHPDARTPAKRRRDDSRTARELEKIGI